jgi:N-acetylmuramoyl-L-alanine amidase
LAGAIVAISLAVALLGGSNASTRPRLASRKDASRSTSTTSSVSLHTTSASLPLTGKVVGIDPGHNGDNYTDPSFIDQTIFNGTGQEACDTTGTATDGGYTEAAFNFQVAQYLAADLRAEGAQVVLTRSSNTGVGPCVTQRAAIINNAHADAAIDIHADGGPPTGRGFTILEPVADGPNNSVIAVSAVLGNDLRAAFLADTVMPISTYDGTDGISLRDDLAGLNLATEPKVLIECGNMRNATDAALLVTPAFQQSAAKAMAQAITTFLTS